MNITRNINKSTTALITFVMKGNFNPNDVSLGDLNLQRLFLSSEKEGEYDVKFAQQRVTSFKNGSGHHIVTLFLREPEVCHQREIAIDEILSSDLVEAIFSDGATSKEDRPIKRLEFFDKDEEFNLISYPVI